ncbi:HAD family phosphatase [Leptolyngbya sp. 15MV]|nr:HAD family phosphatase [Leptolyngbya sp. 15MV]
MMKLRTINPPTPVQAVIFDMDGVIFDTERMYQKTLANAVEHVGGSIDEQTLLLTVGMSWGDCRKMLHRKYSHIVEVDELVARWLELFDALANDGLPLKPGVLELLDILDSAELPRAIATSAYSHDVQRNLDAHSLAHRFDTIVAQGDCVATKPAPDPFLLAAARLNVAPSLCLALEDSVHGVRSASDAGMMTVMVPDTVAAGEQEMALCAWVANDLHEVCQMLETE